MPHPSRCMYQQAAHARTRRFMLEQPVSRMYKPCPEHAWSSMMMPAKPAAANPRRVRLTLTALPYPVSASPMIGSARVASCTYLHAPRRSSALRENTTCRRARAAVHAKICHRSITVTPQGIRGHTGSAAVAVLPHFQMAGKARHLHAWNKARHACAHAEGAGCIGARLP